MLATGFLGSLVGSEPARAVSGVDPLLGSIGLFGGNFAPRGYATCDGQLIPISQNSALFSILGTTYGGDGRTTFALPDLRGRVPVHVGNGPGLQSVALGQTGGANDVALTTNQLPTHQHGATLDLDGSFSLPVTTAEANTTSPDGNVLASPASAVGNRPTSPIYSTTASPDGSMVVEGSSSGGVTVDATGGGQAHPNMQPYLGVNYIIATTGVFPSRS